MMRLQERIGILVQLADYMASDDPAWQLAKQRAFTDNNWFITKFTDLAAQNIREHFLQRRVLENLATQYGIPEETRPGRVGIVMAGNIPLVGFHDLLCCFLVGHYAVFKPSSKDQVLVTHLSDRVKQWHPQAVPYLTSGEYLRECDAYIATGSNNTARHFEYYFKGKPSIIRKNRTSVAVLTGRETEGALEALADDVFQYFGLGCRNVTKLYVPRGYDFEPLLQAFRKYDDLMDFQKYKNNYDYNLAIQLLNNKYYMTNGSVLLTEATSPFSPISQLHYQFYTDAEEIKKETANNNEIQCVIGWGNLPFGKAQSPGITDFADGVDTIAFLQKLSAAESVGEVRRS